MKRVFLILTVLCAVPVFAADHSTPDAATSAATTSETQAPAKKPLPVMPRLTIPKDAKAIGNGKFEYTDTQGEHWIYWTTPLGVSRSEVDGTHAVPATAATSAPSTSTKVTDLGDSVRFENPTPLGKSVVVEKKSDLTQQEQEFVKKRLAEEAAANSGSHE